MKPASISRPLAAPATQQGLALIIAMLRSTDVAPWKVTGWFWSGWVWVTPLPWGDLPFSVLVTPDLVCLALAE